MSQALVYFGIPPSGGHAVSSDLSARGINLLRMAPSAMRIATFPHFIQPHYQIYLQNLPVYLNARITETASRLGNPYTGLNHQTLPGFYRDIPIVWGYNTKISSDRLDQLKNDFGAQELTIKGKPALQAVLTLPKLRTLMTSDPITVVASSNANMNIASFRSYLAILRIADLFLRVHQYPAFRGDTSDALPLWFNTVGMTHMAEQQATAPGESTTNAAAATSQQWFSAGAGHVVAHANVFSDPSTFNYVVTSAAQIPNHHSGLLFPYVSELGRPDSKTVPRVLDTYFKGLLGSDSQDAEDTFQDIKSAWGNILETEWGNVVTHLYQCIDLALTAQSTVRIISDSNTGMYGGCVILGGRYDLFLESATITPVPHADLTLAFPHASPHSHALTRIFGFMMYPDQATRDAAQLLVTNIRDIHLQLMSHPVAKSSEAEVTNLAHMLRFAGQPEYLNSNAHNIARILRAIADPTTNISQIPLHPLAIFEHERKYQLLSAFGAHAPSFRVPGGKQMSLEGSFSVTERNTSGGRIARDVKKIGCILVPFEKAKTDYDQVVSTKSILNPFGNQLGNRMSAQTILRTYEGPSAQDIITALRSVAGISVTTNAGAPSGSRKRGASPGTSGAPAKKRALDI